jgi:hypothetical protein
MQLRTVHDEGIPMITIENLFTTASERTFLLLRREIPYAGRPERFLGEITDQLLSKRLADGSEVSYPKLLVHDEISGQELEFV